MAAPADAMPAGSLRTCCANLAAGRTSLKGAFPLHPAWRRAIFDCAPLGAATSPAMTGMAARALAAASAKKA